MADATGSSTGAGVGDAASHGDLDRSILQGQSQAFLTSSMTKIAPNIPQQIHQYPISQIPTPMRMSMLAPRPLSTPHIAVPPQQIAPPSQTSIRAQPPPIVGSYQPQVYSIGNTTSFTSQGSAEWRMYNNALISSAQTTPLGGGGINNCNINVSSNGFYQNSSMYSSNICTNYVPRSQPYYTNYDPATNESVRQALFFRNWSNNNNKQEQHLGFSTSFGATAPLVSVSPFEPRSLRPNCSSAQICQEANNLDGISRAFVSREIEGSDISDESNLAPELDDDGDTNGANFRLNCKDYNTVLCKYLTNSDCGNMGRIVVPKRAAEVNLPALVDKDGMILEMDDFELPEVWRFKYRYWSNNKSRMYVLETTGEFVKRHNLRSGDILVIYYHKRTVTHVARAVKAIQLNSTRNMIECQCMEADNSVEECGFTVPIKKKYDI